MSNKKVYILFGVSGIGKTTIGQSLAKELNIPFYDADDYHPAHNIDKMASGQPLNDLDREPWLGLLAMEIKKWNTQIGAVLACSALKETYREMLQSIDSQYLEWIFLDGSFELVAERMEARDNHFFKKEMLFSQFQALERPKRGITIDIDIDKSREDIIAEIILKLNNKQSQIGLIGLGVMGKSLAKNFLSRGYRLSVYNRQVKGKEEDVAAHFVKEQSDNTTVLGFDKLEDFVNSLETPKTIMLMVNAGKPVDMVIEALLPMLSKGDCIIDGGNCHYKLTAERYERLDKIGIHFLGTGISGGEEGALKGPSIMPGGSQEGYKKSGVFLEAIAAKDKKGNPCCTFIGPEGAGHYVKMVHNGIEYAEMQLLAETYHFLRFYLKKEPDQIADIFQSWNIDELQSYLLEITVDILRKKEGDAFLIDKVLDKAKQKGTGGWSTNAALEVGVPLSTISEAVMARNISGMKSERVKASEIYQVSRENKNIDVDDCIKKLKKSYRAASIVNHHIGFDLMKQASEEYNWNLNLSEVARIWTNGCIIRSTLMEQISELLADDTDTSLLLFPSVVNIMKSTIDSLSEIVSLGLIGKHSVPVFSAAANYFLTYTSAQSSANIIQAQRDYFGAHMYQRLDRDEEEYFHTNWKE